MYLHQQIVDNILLLTTKKLVKLHGTFVNRVVNDKDITHVWLQFMQLPNIISKLRYQYVYNDTKFIPSVIWRNKFTYIHGYTTFINNVKTTLPRFSDELDCIVTYKVDPPKVVIKKMGNNKLLSVTTISLY